ncbi:PPOX class F420-dependent oxidoreductase [Tsukamurella sp. 8F]|uniref:PPOX class F420-dependent oxidoreductase n=1 Tax=unclassified Tsukamurella TaxID=2633480 RepID=UPI0023B9799C|nr:MULTISPECIES: PPOX class F420-dependent oxidoreductase [unclassified Tsukamurella]MDF0530730.1 PPOX class F420-dependent oxidoreductase [Tsukamurella sp. 8J]MDF0587931.1 PPOX class F420-dependent oxidoreductase [Tsukamurella sp. 8F]
MATDRRAEIAMTDHEVADFLAVNRTATLGTVGRDGRPHLVAMWYAILDGEVWFETKAKSQKAVNLRRDPRCSVLVEDGATYDALRGVELEGDAQLTGDPAIVLRVGIGIWERYVGPYDETQRAAVDAMMHNRVCVRLVVGRRRSWNHRKLGMPPMPVAGTTAPSATYGP